MQATLKIALLALVLTLSGPLLLHARQQEFTFEHLTTADGLATHTVNTIFQDAQGFLWFGTEKGLHKYDGYRITGYQHDEDTPHSLSHNRVTAIHEDQEEALWVGTRDGLNRFDRATARFTRYRHDPEDPHSLGADRVTSLCVDRDGVLWVGTRFSQPVEQRLLRGAPASLVAHRVVHAKGLRPHPPSRRHGGDPGAG